MDRGRAEEELKTGILGIHIHFGRLVPQGTGYCPAHMDSQCEWGSAVAACGRLKDGFNPTSAKISSIDRVRTTDMET